MKCMFLYTTNLTLYAYCWSLNRCLLYLWLMRLLNRTLWKGSPATPIGITWSTAGGCDTVFYNWPCPNYNVNGLTKSILFNLKSVWQMVAHFRRYTLFLRGKSWWYFSQEKHYILLETYARKPWLRNFYILLS